MDLEDIEDMRREADTEGQTLPDPTLRRSLEESEPQRQEGDGGAGAGGGEGGVKFHGDGGAVWEGERGLEMDGCTCDSVNALDFTELCT